MKNDNSPSAELLAGLQLGDVRSEEHLHARYLNRLLALARSRLSQQLTVRTDPDDIVQSAFRSFFLRARQGQFELRRSGDLWRLLARITMRKLYRHVEHHQAARRSVGREQRLQATESAMLSEAAFLSSEPTPEAAAAFVEQLETCMADSTPLERQVLQLRLQEHTIDEIAQQVQRSERTVRRNLDSIRKRLRTAFEEVDR